MHRRNLEDRRASKGLVLALILIGMAVAGCDSGAGRPYSGGFVRELGAESANRQQVTIAPDPLLRLGGGADGEATEFTQIGDAVIGQDGVISVLNIGTAELRVFDKGGKHLRTVGRRGQGPGEFSRPVLVPTIRRDTLLVADRSGPVTAIAPSAGTYRVLGSFGAIGDAGGESGGSLFIHQTLSTASGNSETGETVNQVALDAIDLGSQTRARIAVYDGRRMYVAMPSAEQMQDPTQRPRVRFLTVPFTTDPSFAPSPRGLYVRDGWAPEIKEVDRTGRILRIIRVNVPPVEVSSRNFNTAVEEDVALINGEVERARLGRYYSDMRRPSNAPIFGKLLTDPQGRLWAQYLGLDRGKSRTWMVFDESGGILGTVKIPGSGAVTSVGDDAIVTITTDELGIEAIEVYALTWSARA